MSDTKSSVIFESTDTTGKKLQKTLTDINPDVDSVALRTFTQSLNSLTTNTYVGTSRVDKTDLANAVAKTTPTFTINPARVTLMGEPVSITLTYNGDAKEFVFPMQNMPSTQQSLQLLTVGGFTHTTGTNTYTFQIGRKSGSTGVQGTLKIQAPETDNYLAAEVSLTIVAGD